MKSVLLGLSTLGLFTVSIIGGAFEAQSSPERLSFEEPNRSCVTVQSSPYKKTTSCTGSGSACETVSEC